MSDSTPWWLAGSSETPPTQPSGSPPAPEQSDPWPPVPTGVTPEAGAGAHPGATDPGAAPGHGAPGFGPPAFGPPGYGPPGYGAPGYGPPEYGPPEYGPPEYGRPGYGPPGYPPSPNRPAGAPRRRRGAVGAAGAALLLIGAAAGVGVGHAVWSDATSSTASAAPGSGGGTSGGSGSGSNPSPFGGFGSGAGPGSSSGGGSTSTAAGSPSDVSAIASKVDPGLVDINTTLKYQGEEGAGTGMVLTPTGLILTNNHVIDEETSISVTDIGNGKTYSATVVGYDRSQDVAVLQLSGASGLKTISQASSPAGKGQAVVGIGNAGGAGGTPSVAGGSVTALDRSITASDAGDGTSEQLSALIETNADIQPGDSGGPLVNASGQVLGMDTAASETFSFTDGAGQGYAIPISEALSIAQQIEHGDSSSDVHIGATAFFGVDVEATTGSSESGVLVAGALPGTPAAKEGFAEGDVITSVDGTSVTSPATLTHVLGGYHPGDSVSIGWTDANGTHRSTSVTLASGPPG